MCYLVAKEVNKVGSIALQTAHGKQLSEFKNELIKKLVTIEFSLLQSADHQRMGNMNHTRLWLRKKNLKKL